MVNLVSDESARSSSQPWTPRFARLQRGSGDRGIGVVPLEVGRDYRRALGSRIVPLSDAWAYRRFVVCSYMMRPVISGCCRPTLVGLLLTHRSPPIDFWTSNSAMSLSLFFPAQSLSAGLSGL